MQPLQFLKCLSDPTRLHCTLLIQEAGEICVCDLVTSLDESQPKISRHLAQLRNCGLLTSTKKEQWVFYSINPKIPKWAKNILKEIQKSNDPGILKLHTAFNRITNKANCC